jgi:hypothetical protein
MFRTVLQAFMSPVAGPTGFVLAIALLAMLATSVYSAQHTEAALRSRITELTNENARNQIALHARLAACESAPADADKTRQAIANLTPEQRAQRLSDASPQGFDVCARMESADRAVLETLK